MTTQGLDKSETIRIETSVRKMAAAISRDLAQDGPTAWLRHFAETPEFFMAANGKLQFANLGQARDFLPGYSAGVAHLELTWTDIRVDPIAPGMAVMGAAYKEVFTDRAKHDTEWRGYFTGLAVETNSGWKLRDAHWSMAAAAQR